MFMYRGTACAQKQTHMVRVAPLMCLLCLAAADQQASCCNTVLLNPTAKGTPLMSQRCPRHTKSSHECRYIPESSSSCGLLHERASLQEIHYVSKASPSPDVTERHPGPLPLAPALPTYSTRFHIE